MAYLILLLFFEIVFFCFIFVTNKKDIMAPSVIMSLVFIFSTTLALSNSARWDFYFEFETFGIIALGITLFGITDVLISNTRKRGYTKVQSTVPEPIIIEKWKLIAICLVDLVIVLLVLNEVRRIAATNTWFTNIFYAYRVITSHSEDLSPDQYMNGIVNQAMKIVIVSGFAMAAFWINNVLICKEKFSKNILYAIPPILLCVMTIFTGVRTNILRLAVFSLIVGYVLLQNKKEWKVKTSWKFIRVLAIAFVVVVVVFGVLQSVLGRTAGSTAILTVISNYAGAPFLHFNQYIQDPPAANLVFGQETFAGVWNVLYKLGLTAASYSAHEEYRYISDTDFGNVYTIFRRFVQDFGFIGMCFMMVLTSAIFSFFYNWKIKYRQLNYRQWKRILVYGYMFYIIAMSSIDNLIHDYINIGTGILFITLQLMFWFLFKLKVKFKS